VEEPEPARVLGLRSTFSPRVLVVENVIGPVNPLTGVIVTLDVPWLPALSVRLVGLAAMLKSRTLTVITRVCTSGPLVPVIVTV
jgi:hypothetical protein